MFHQPIRKIAWFTRNFKNEGSISRSAYLTKNIVPLLLQSGVKVDIFSDEVTEFYIDEKHSLPVHHFLTAGLRHEKDPFSLFFHQVEEGVANHFLRTAVGLYPGVTYFHDLYLSDLGPDPLTNSPWSWVFETLFSATSLEQKEWPDRLKEFPRKGPFPEREVGLSFATISPSVRFCDDISRSVWAEKKLNFFCPYPIAQELFDRAISPRANNLPLTIALFGSPNIEDRVHKLFLGIKNLGASVKVKWLLPEAQKEIAQKRSEEFGIKCEFFHSISPESWFRIVSESDAAVQLRFSAFGSLSPYIDAALLTTRPVLVTDFGDSDYYPNFITRIPMGSFEAGSVTKELAAIAEQRGQSNVTAKLFVSENNNADQILHHFMSAFSKVIESQSALQERWKHIQRNAFHQFEGNLFEKEYRELGW